MDKASDCEKKRDKQSMDLEILRKNEEFWQKAVKVLARIEISETKVENAENDNKGDARHTEKVFNIFCKCYRCLAYRQCLTGVYVENCAYNQLWSKLQEIIRSYYQLLPTDHESLFNRKYQELLRESCGIRWFSDGSIDVKKSIHLSMGSYFSISNEMTFMIVFNMLYARDRHQLFELLCLQLTSIILSYRESIKEITKCVDGDDEYYKPEEFLNFILNGYDRISEISETQTPLVIEMRDHLQKFSLTWQLMNQCMYYRFLYVDIESRMADCILRLKDAVDVETYKNFVYRFIKFDEEMTAIGQVWEVALVALELYRNSTPEQVSRVERIGLTRQIFQSLRNLRSIEENVGKPLGDQVLALDWIVSSEKNEVWQSVLSSIKKENECNSKKDACKCWACSITDGNSVPDICALPLESNGAVEKKKKNEDCYHLAWAVFKHLRDRQPYSKPFFHPELFCVFNDPPCQRMECLVATNLIIGSYPSSFTKFLLRTYEPLSLADREKFLKIPSQSLIKKFCRKKGGAAAKEIMQEADEINHTFLLLHMFWDDDEIADPLLRAGLASALAENFKVDIKFPQKHIIFSYFYALFRMDAQGVDITLDLEWLEQINLGNLFKSFGAISSSLNTHHHHLHNHDERNSPISVEPLEMHLNELKITAEVSAGSNALDLVQFSMKEVADKLSSISLSDDNESAKAVIENEIKKPLVEALKLAASNKKLEAELKSLQKEHNMLKDMVKGLEQIHGDKKEVQVTVTTTTTTKPTMLTDLQTSEFLGMTSKCSHGNGRGHSHCHSHSESRSPSPSPCTDDHGKDDCVCYYCTLFGKNQDLVTNPRSTEARDRLRKKLHHLQNQKDSISASSMLTGSNITTPSSNVNKSKNMKNISLLLKNGSSPSNGNKKEGTTIKGTTSITGNSNGTSMKMKVELELQQRKKKTLLKPAHFLGNKQPEDVKIQRVNELNVKSLENLIEYIEGPTSKAVVEHKKAQEAEAKKQQKKLRAQQMKVRRQVEQQIDEMKGLNGDIQEVTIEIKQIQNQLTQLKAGKGKKQELKRIKTAEDKLSMLSERRNKFEIFVKAVATEANTLCPEINLVDECQEFKGILSIIAPEALIQERKPVKSQQPQMLKLVNSSSKTQTVMMSTSSSEEDPAKRMVTIRRVNMPHSEPQVTVTAKGTTPDMDQLLYTFVNGQLVPASNLPATAFQNANGSIQLFMSDNNGRTKMPVQMMPPNTDQFVNEVVVEKVNEGNKKKEKDKKVEKSLKEVEKPPKEAEKPTTKEVLNKKKIDKKKEPVKKDDKKKKKEEDDSQQKMDMDEEKKRKIKKAYIDPEFASNPFKLLDDDGGDITDETEEDEVEHMEVDEVKVEVKKPQAAQSSNKNDKNAQKKQQPSSANQKSKLMERQESVASNNSKDSKQTKKQQKKVIADQQQHQNQAYNSQPFPLHPQYPTHHTGPSHQSPSSTVYKPTDYINSNVKKLSQQQQQPQQQQQFVQASHLQPSPTSAHSIMDQLNRGVKVEGLRLPPGITLTKVSPGNSDPQHNKRESINRIAQPMQDYTQQSAQHQQQQNRMDNDMVFSQGRDPNGIIMVESNPHGAYKQQQQVQQSESAATSNGKKKNKKKNKNKNGDDASNKSNLTQTMGGSGTNSGGDRMVTLKNPMFYNNNNTNNSNNSNNNNNGNNNNTNNGGGGSSKNLESMMRNLQTPPFVSPMEQNQASIVKNENGMYTIRNPAFQSIFTGGYNNGMMGNQQQQQQQQQQQPTQHNANSNFMPSSTATSSSTSNMGGNSSAFSQYEPDFNQQTNEMPKCNSVIGSEMKNVLQRRKEQEYMDWNQSHGMRSQYSHFGGMNFNGNNCDDGFGRPARPSSSGSGCYPSYPSPTMANYDELRLQPGKMLNSEVTIHNVTESKFFQSQKAQAPIGTPRNMTNEKLSNATNAGGPKLFGEMFGGEQNLVSRPHAPSDYNEGIFGTSQGRKSIELDSEERDIEMFKQFDLNYVPPKQKIKCNINMNEIVVNPKKTALTHAMGDDYEGRKQPSSSTNSNSPSSLASSSMDELYEKAYYEKASSLFSSNGM